MSYPRNPEHERHCVTVRVPVALLARLDAECDARVVSRNLIVTKAIEHYLDALPPVEGPHTGSKP